MGDNVVHGYALQLEIYAWLWWETHGRSSRVQDLRIWYAGSNQVKQVSAPDEERLLELDIQLRETYDSLFEKRSEDVVDYPAKPAPLELFEAGGIHVGTSRTLSHDVSIVLIEASVRMEKIEVNCQT